MNKLSKFLLVFALLNSIAFSADFSRDFIYNGQQATLKITDEAWNHILVGKEENGVLKGCHDFGQFLAHYSNQKRTSKRYFDNQNGAYIVESKKGMILAEIFYALSHGDMNVQYHSLFPKDYLTQEIVFQAFSQSMIEHTIDWKNHLFYTSVDNVKIAGYFEKKVVKTKNKNKKTIKKEFYYIKSAFPDLAWEYRINFRHRANEDFNPAHFFEWNHIDKIWVLMGNFNPGETFDFPFTPEGNIGHVIFAENYDEPRQELTHREFSTGQVVADSLKELTKINVLDFFFANPESPSEEEIATLIKYLKILIPQFVPSSGNDRKNKINPALALKRKVLSLRLAINNKINEGANGNALPVHVLRHTEEQGSIFQEENLGTFMAQVGKGRVNATGLHLGEEILQQMLLIHSIETSLRADGVFNAQQEFVYELAANYFERFLKYAVPNADIRQNFNNENLIISLNLIHYESGHDGYRLLVWSKNASPFAHRQQVAGGDVKGSQLFEVEVFYNR